MGVRGDEDGGPIQNDLNGLVFFGSSIFDALVSEHQLIKAHSRPSK